MVIERNEPLENIQDAIAPFFDCVIYIELGMSSFSEVRVVCLHGRASLKMRTEVVGRRQTKYIAMTPYGIIGR